MSSRTDSSRRRGGYNSDSDHNHEQQEATNGTAIVSSNGGVAVVASTSSVSANTPRRISRLSRPSQQYSLAPRERGVRGRRRHEPYSDNNNERWDRQRVRYVDIPVYSGHERGERYTDRTGMSRANLGTEYARRANLGTEYARRAFEYHAKADGFDARAAVYERSGFGSEYRVDGSVHQEIPTFSKYPSQYKTKMCVDSKCTSHTCEFAHDKRDIRCSFFWGSQGCKNTRVCKFIH